MMADSDQNQSLPVDGAFEEEELLVVEPSVSDEQVEESQPVPGTQEEPKGCILDSVDNEDAGMDNVDANDFKRDKRAWYNQCTYKCKECHKLFTTYKTIQTHVHVVHKNAKGAISREEERLWECQICSKIVICDLVHISKHLRTCHRMTMKTFEEEHGPSDQIGRTKSEIQSEAVQKLEDCPANEIADLNAVERPWHSQCTYSCRACGKLLISYNSGKTHARNYHPERKGVVVRIKEEFWKCLICDRSVTCDTNSIHAHLQYKHELSMKKFIELHMPDEMSNVRKRRRKRAGEPSKKSKRKKHVKSDCSKDNEGNHDLDKIQEEFLVTKQPEEEQKPGDDLDGNQDPTNLDKCDPAISRSASTEAVEDYKRDKRFWYNQCTYKCSICQRLFITLRSIKNHARIEHQNEKDIIVKVDEPLWTCKICQDEVTCDFVHVSKHLQDCHQMNFDDYEKQYVPAAPVSHRRQTKKTSAYGQKISLEDFPPDEVAVISAAERPWHSHCTYGCDTCKKLFINYSSAKSHTRRFHSVTKGVISRVKDASWTCLLCNQVILCDKATIRCHVNLQHKLSLDKFEELHLPKEKVKKYLRVRPAMKPRTTRKKTRFPLTMPKKSPSKKKEMVEFLEHESDPKVPLMPPTMVQQIIDVHMMDEKEIDYKEIKVEEQEVTKETDPPKVDSDLADNVVVKKQKSDKRPWYNQCTYRCNMCQRLFTSFKSIKAHSSIVHKSAEGDVINVDQPLWTCKICFKKEIYDFIHLSKHVGKSHHMTLKEYEKEHVPNAVQGLVKKSILGFIHRTLEEFPKNEVAAINATERPWDSHCTYGCNECDKLFSTYESAKCHAQKLHPSSNGVISRIEEVFWTCLLCNQVITCDRNPIGTHLRLQHKLSIDKFVELHMPEEKKIVEVKKKKTQAAASGILTPKIEYDCDVGHGEHPFGSLVVDGGGDDSLGGEIKVEEDVLGYEDDQPTPVQTNKLMETPGITPQPPLWQCKVCNVNMICDQNYITEHLKTHNATIDQYNEKFASVNQEQDSETINEQSQEQEENIILGL